MLKSGLSGLRLPRMKRMYSFLWLLALVAAVCTTPLENTPSNDTAALATAECMVEGDPGQLGPGDTVTTTAAALAQLGSLRGGWWMCLVIGYAVFTLVAPTWKGALVRGAVAATLSLLLVAFAQELVAVGSIIAGLLASGHAGPFRSHSDTLWYEEDVKESYPEGAAVAMAMMMLLFLGTVVVAIYVFAMAVIRAVKGGDPFEGDQAAADRAVDSIMQLLSNPIVMGT